MEEPSLPKPITRAGRPWRMSPRPRMTASVEKTTDCPTRKAMLREGVGSQHVGPPSAVGPAYFEFGVRASVACGVRQFQLEQVVGDGLQGECASGGARGVGEEP